MSLMNIHYEAKELEKEIGKHGDVKREHIVKLARLVAELASAASSATDPRNYGDR
jgi:hypothetical protein